MGSLRGRLVVASFLWTAGLLLVMHMASLFLVFLFPRFRGAHSFLAVFVAFGLMGAGLWVARRGLARFALLREELAAVRAGRAARISGSYASEVAPLIGELNGLLEERERAVRRAFAAAGDLAHGLKTPLAVLGQSGDPGVSEQVERMARLVQYHLARARVAASGVAAPLPVGECVAGLVRTFGKLFPGISVSVSVGEGVLVRVEREDLEEILGNLLENACKWGRGRVVLGVVVEGAWVVFFVEDDGPGVEAALREVVLERGVRFDEAGSGLGLAIVRDLVEVYGGRISLGEAGMGGLRVEVRLPGVG